MLRTPESTLIPGAVGPVSNRSPRKLALSWSHDQREFIDWLKTTWNKHFKGKPGGKACYNVRPNNGAAQRFFNRLSDMPESERFSRDDIAAAIEAYATNPANLALKPPTWRYFKDWIDEAEDRIAAELARIGRAVGTSDKAATDAHKIIKHLGLDRTARTADQLNRTLGEHIEFARDTAARDAAKSNTETNLNVLAHWKHLANVKLRFLAQSKEQTAAFMRSAADLFAAVNHRRPTPRTDDNAVKAIALALFDRSVAQSVPQSVAPVSNRCSEVPDA